MIDQFFIKELYKPSEEKYFQCLFSEVDRNLVENKNWFICPRNYIHGSVSTEITYRRSLPFHYHIIKRTKGLDVDHINRQTLDNRRTNLRVVSRSQNIQNGNKRKNTKSKYKGVFWYKGSGKWSAGIQKNLISYHLGYFLTEEDAARAYDKAAIKLFGIGAYTNFPSK
jgi:hypothetical protein